MIRYAMDELVKWKDRTNRKPLILQGARQVGKTWLMKEFGRLYFKKVAYISFYNNENMKRVFDEDYDIQRIIMNINIAAKVEVLAEDTLIILDEIQECPRALESLKYFCEDAPEYAVIVAGSLLGVAIHKGISFPVGKVNSLKIHPMNFLEFLEAQGESSLVNAVKTKQYDVLKNYSAKYIFWLKNYYYVGGMPEVVSFFSEHKDYQEVRRLQKEILNQYENDFGKHAQDTNLSRIRMIWNSIPMQLAKENRKFFFGQIKTGARMKDFEIAIEWLKDCGLITMVYKVSKPSLPLKAYIDLSAFKLFVLDVGLLGAMSDLNAQSILEGGDMFTQFKGALAEQYVLQELIATTPYQPYYYGTSSNTFEMDFMIQKDMNIVPIEVKSGVSTQAKSLKLYCENYKPTYAVRFSLLDYKEQENITNIPLYAICNI